MTRDELAAITVGDVVRHVTTGEAYTVVYKGSEAVAVRALTVCNPSEWEIVRFSAFPKLEKHPPRRV